MINSVERAHYPRPLMIPNIILMFPAQSSLLTKIAQIIMHSFRDSKVRNKGFLDCLSNHENYETEKRRNYWVLSICRMHVLNYTIVKFHATLGMNFTSKEERKEDNGFGCGGNWLPSPVS